MSYRKSVESTEIFSSQHCFEFRNLLFSVQVLCEIYSSNFLAKIWIKWDQKFEFDTEMFDLQEFIDRIRELLSFYTYQTVLIKSLNLHRLFLWSALSKNSIFQKNYHVKPSSSVSSILHTFPALYFYKRLHNLELA